MIDYIIYNLKSTSLVVPVLVVTILFSIRLYQSLVGMKRRVLPIKSLEETTLPILIVGAGPTGLTLAAVLVRYAVPFRIIEKKNHLSRHTKATNLMQRNQEFIFALGLLNKLQGIGGSMHRPMVHAYGKGFGPRTMHMKESPFSDVILCGQHNFETTLANDLIERGLNIEFGTELIGLKQDSKGATVSLLYRNIEEDIYFSYMVGCDGYAGVSRKFTCHDFEPFKTGVAIRQLDCKLQWHRQMDMAQMWILFRPWFCSRCATTGQCSPYPHYRAKNKNSQSQPYARRDANETTRGFG